MPSGFFYLNRLTKYWHKNNNSRAKSDEKTLMTKDTLLHKAYLVSRKSISRVVAKIVPPHEIEDIVQETYVRICKIENSDNTKMRCMRAHLPIMNFRIFVKP